MEIRKRIALALLPLMLLSFSSAAVQPAQAPEDLARQSDQCEQQTQIGPTGRRSEVYQIPYKDFDLSTKTYMDYRKITDKTSNQYRLIWSDQINLNDKGFLVYDNKWIGVAMGSYFGEIGERFLVWLDGKPEPLKLIIVERKADKHTCENNFMAANNDVIEFVIDSKSDYMRQNTHENGLVWSGNFNNCPEFSGNILKIEKVIDVEKPMQKGLP